MEKGEVVVSQ